MVFWRSVVVRLLASCGVALCVTSLVLAAVDAERMQQWMAAHYGQDSVVAYRAWRQMLTQAASAGEREKLEQVNGFFDRALRFRPDSEIWKQADYWATPLESLGKGAGDCEDYVIGKYFSLVELGVPPAKLRWIYVVASIGGVGSKVTEPHMVLGYYASPGAEPLILDNLTSSILPASRRPDLSPVFSFNSDGIWRNGAAASSGSVSQLSLWRELMRKMKEQGYEP